MRECMWICTPFVLYGSHRIYTHIHIYKRYLSPSPECRHAHGSVLFHGVEHFLRLIRHRIQHRTADVGLGGEGQGRMSVRVCGRETVVAFCSACVGLQWLAPPTKRGKCEPHCHSHCYHGRACVHMPCVFSYISIWIYDSNTCNVLIIDSRLVRVVRESHDDTSGVVAPVGRQEATECGDEVYASAVRNRSGEGLGERGERMSGKYFLLALPVTVTKAARDWGRGRGVSAGE